MKNKEKFVKEIVEIAIKSQSLSVNQEGKINCCQASQCKNCIFYHGAGRCCDKRKEWAEAEYVEPKEFTEEEKAFIRACDKIKYLAKDKDGHLYLYENKPIKSVDNGIWYGSRSIDTFFTSLQFSAIKWEDAEPTSRKEILK